jgi:hypothetical protein
MSTKKNPQGQKMRLWALSAEKPTETTLKAFIYQIEFGFPKQILKFESI